MCVCVLVKRSGGGLLWDKRKKKDKGQNDKGRRDGEHEVGLDRTMGLRVTFELSLRERADYGFVGKDSGEESALSAKECSRFKDKSLVAHAIMS